MSSTVQVNFRMPTELKEMLESAAKKSNRTTTSEIVARLEQSFSSDLLPEGIDTKKLVGELSGAIEQLRKELGFYQSQLSESLTESREMRMLYIEAVNRNLTAAPLDMKSELAQKLMQTVQEHTKKAP